MRLLLTSPPPAVSEASPRDGDPIIARGVACRWGPPGSGKSVPDLALAIFGWLLLALTGYDVFRTVLWSSQGAGPVTAVLTKAARGVRSALGSGRPRAQSAIGPAALLGIVVSWAVLLLVGFTLVLQIDPEAIRTAPGDQPTDWTDRAYFVGFTLFTLGMGDIVPVSDTMRAVTVLMNAAGMFLITLSVTYLLPVISASVSSRSFGSSTSALGASAEEIVIEAWDGNRVHLDHQIRELATQLSTLAHQHLAYPVLHLFRSSDPSSSAPHAVVVLDDVLTLLDGVDPTVAPPAPGRRQLRASIDDYVTTSGSTVDGSGRGSPASGVLIAAGIPLRPGDEAVARPAQR